MARHHQDFTTSDPNVTVHTTWTYHPASTKKISIRAYAIDTRSGVRLDGSKIKKRTVRSPAEIPQTQNYLCKAVMDDVDHSSRKVAVRKTSEDISDVPMLIAYHNVVNSSDPVSATWGPEYQARQLTYFRRHILPELLRHDDWGTDDSDQLQHVLSEKILATKRSAGDSTTAEKTAAKSLASAHIIYQRMRDVDPSLPDISLQPKFVGRRGQREQIKSLLNPIRQSLCGKITALATDNPRLAAGAVIMYDCGLRTAEAAAVHPNGIVNTPDISSVFVSWQIKDGTRTKILKSKNAYRLVPMSAWGSAMLALCFSSIGPLTDEEPLCDPRKLSAIVKEMLISSGLHENQYFSAESAMREKPDYDAFNKPIYDVAAYILRRDWASRARNICGLTSSEIDYLLGHKIAKKNRADYPSLAKQEEIAHKLDRYVHDPAVSRHPKYRPYKLGHAVDIDLMPYDMTRVINTSNEPIIVKLDIESALHADSISIIAPATRHINHTRRLINTHCIRSPDPIIGCGENTEEPD